MSRPKSKETVDTTIRVRKSTLKRLNDKKRQLGREVRRRKKDKKKGFSQSDTIDELMDRDDIRPPVLW